MRGDPRLYRKRGIWYADLGLVDGRRVRESLKTTDRDIAERIFRARAHERRLKALADRSYHRLRAQGQGATVELDGDQVLALRGPLVYAWERTGRVLYVGKSVQGMVRPLHPRHHQLQAIEPTDTVRIWRCADGHEADALEWSLIRKLKPELNRRTT